MKRLWGLFLAFVMVLGLITGCTNTGNMEPEPTQPDGTETQQPETTPSGIKDPEVEYKDTIVYVTNTDQNVLDGQMNNTNETILRTIYNGLVKLDPETGEMIPDLAESYSVSEDGCVWTFNLRKDVYFHNGKQLTSADVKASYDRLLDKDNPVRYTSTMGIIASCDVIDEFTVTLSTAEPMAAFIPNLLHRANLILDKDYIEKYGTELGLTTESVNGTGPYKLVSWSQGEEMVFEANEKYYAGMPLTNNLIVQVIDNATSRAIALETGECDIADTIAAEDITRFENLEDVKILGFNYIGTHVYQFNCSTEHMSDVRLRQAVVYAVNTEEIVNVLYSSKGETVCTAPLSPGVWGYSDMGEIPYNPDKAKQLMTEAGHPDGFDITICIRTSYDKAQESAEMMVQQLAKVGINASIEIVESAVWSEACTSTYPGEKMSWDMFLTGQAPATCDADGMRRYYTTETAGTNANNYGWYSNERVDELLAAGAKEMDETKRKEIYEEIMHIIWAEDPAGIWINNRLAFFGTTDSVSGFQVDVRKAPDFSKVLIVAD
ncbi:MAG: hypothetical protein DBX63_09360 [Clostridia bacterium]|nr:MAG: hypothetical protein DBX63_09360 [Clostridia bacterium]